MATLTFNAIGYCKALEAGGFTRQQAETLVEVQQQVVQEILDSRDLVTKADLDIAVTKLQAAFQTEIATKIAEAKTSLIKWMVGLFVAQISVMFAFFALLPQISTLIKP